MSTKKDNQLAALFASLILLMSFVFVIMGLSFDSLTFVKIVSDTPSEEDMQNYANCDNHYSGTTTSKTPSIYYIFGVTQNNDGDSVVFDTCNSTFAAHLYFFDSGWNVIGNCDICDECVVSPIHSGTHYLGITGSDEEYGDYEVEIKCVNQYITPSPTQEYLSLPKKGVSQCGWNSFDDDYEMNNYFFCKNDYCGYEPESGLYDEYCDNWSVFCDMKSSGKQWLIFGISSIIIGIITFIGMIYDYCNDSKCVRIFTAFLIIIYSIICVVNSSIYENSNCGSDYCHNFLPYITNLYRCDWWDDGLSLILMDIAGPMGFLSFCVYTIGSKVARKFNQHFNERKKEILVNN